MQLLLLSVHIKGSFENVSTLFSLSLLEFHSTMTIMPTYATEQQVWVKSLFCFMSHLLNSASIVPYDLSLNHVAAVLCPLPLTEG